MVGVLVHETSPPNVFAQSVLSPTLRRAASHSFYRNRWSARSSELASLGDDDWRTAMRLLYELPALTKPDLAELLPELEEGDHIAEVIHSSGTGGRFSFRYRSARELAEIRLLVGEAMLSCPASPRVCLSLASLFHGQNPVRRSAPDALWISASLTEDLFVHHTIELLRRPPRIGLEAQRIFMVSGPIAEMKVLSRCVLDAGLHPAMFGVSAIGVFGGRLTPEARRDLAATWRAPVVESYSLSEFGGGAVVCPRCEALSFDPHLLPTPVWMQSPGPNEGGTGLLHLTELLPFGQCQPLVNYATGDLVERVTEAAACCAEHVGLLRCLGRQETSALLRLANGGLLCIGASAFRDALETDGVARGPTHVQLASLRNRDRLGSPIAETFVEQRFDRPVVRVAFRAAEGAEGDEVAQRVWQRLLAACPGLRAAIDGDLVCLDITASDAVSARLTK